MDAAYSGVQSLIIGERQPFHLSCWVGAIQSYSYEKKNINNK